MQLRQALFGKLQLHDTLRFQRTGVLFGKPAVRDGPGLLVLQYLYWVRRAGGALLRRNELQHRPYVLRPLCVASDNLLAPVRIGGMGQFPIKPVSPVHMQRGSAHKRILPLKRPLMVPDDVLHTVKGASVCSFPACKEYINLIGVSLACGRGRNFGARRPARSFLP